MRLANLILRLLFLKRLAKSVLVPLGLPTSATDVAIQKKTFG